MTKLLEKAFKKASQLPDIEQNSFAKWVLEELEAEKKWDKIISDSESLLDKLADEALDAHRKDRTQSLDINKL
ncbi:MAG: hypothetical protein IIB83_06865 [Bacteroidetes bacterium]|nr:hypothetical protein [Bacteroidota bacterium]MCH8326263.1 hypothetical protein [Bacteroidota bacterium]